MWAKRFPLAEFDYENLKDLSWSEPSFLADDGIDEQITRVSTDGNGSPRCFSVNASDSFFDRFNISGKFRHAVLCVTPDKEISLIGRSHAWKKQRLLIVDSLNSKECNVLIDWKTGRPMSTRLGPKNGTTIQGGAWYVIFSHIISDRFVGNRSILNIDSHPTGESGYGDGFSVLSSSESEFNDFHDCNLYATW